MIHLVDLFNKHIVLSLEIVVHDLRDFITSSAVILANSEVHRDLAIYIRWKNLPQVRRLEHTADRYAISSAHTSIVY